MHFAFPMASAYCIIPPRKLHAMSTMGDRLREARERAGLSIEEMARAVGAKVPTYTQHENGIRNYPAKKAAQYAEFLRTTPEWLLYGRKSKPQIVQAAPANRARTIPVISWVAAGQLADPDSQPPAEEQTIEISGLPPGDYFGTKARGDSMNRIAPDDSLLIVNRADRELVRGRRYIFTHRGKTTFKRFGGRDPYRLEPESWNPEHDPIYPKDGEKWEVIGRVTMVVAEI